MKTFLMEEHYHGMRKVRATHERKFERTSLMQRVAEAEANIAFLLGTDLL